MIFLCNQHKQHQKLRKFRAKESNSSQAEKSYVIFKSENKSFHHVFQQFWSLKNLKKSSKRQHHHHAKSKPHMCTRAHPVESLLWSHLFGFGTSVMGHY